MVINWETKRKANDMTELERFYAICNYKKTDGPLCWETFGFWGTTEERWRKEGLPQNVSAMEYFKIGGRTYIPVNSGYTNIPFYPEFERVIYSDDGEYITYMNPYGIIIKEKKIHSETCMPQFIKFPVENMTNFKELLWRWNPDSPSRYPDWKKTDKNYRNFDKPLVMTVCGAYGTPRNLIGVEKLSYMFYDNPELIHAIQKHWLYFYKRVMDRTLPNIRVDFILIWEDMAYKTAPLISPEMFKEFILPYYQELVNHAKKLGVKYIMVDSDGNNFPIMELFIEAGVNMFMPLEIAAGMEPLETRKRYGHKLILWGGIDKRVLSKDKKAIEDEVMSKVPVLLSEGGYIPAIDHSVPYDVPFENYKYFTELVRSLW